MTHTKECMYNFHAVKGNNICTCSPTEKKIEGWEESFENEFGDRYFITAQDEDAYREKIEEVKSFISALLLSSQETAREGERERVRGKVKKILKEYESENDSYQPFSELRKDVTRLSAALSETKK